MFFQKLEERVNKGGKQMNENKKVATRQSFGEALLELGKVNENIVVLDADLSAATKTSIFAKEFPKRFFDMGIAEQDMMGMAAGLALRRKNSFCKYICDFCIRKGL